jgi:ferric-dicitrate binding protein FerR (iron transport regulator)
MNHENNQTAGSKINKLVSNRTDQTVQAYFDQLEDLDKPSSTQSEHMFSTIMDEIQTSQADTNHDNIRKISARKTILLFRKSIAAVLILAICALFAWIWLKPNQTMIKTNFAENKNIILPDGSKVILNANSSLSYSNDWEDSADRKVKLEGEGYFSVKKGVVKGQKFEVITKGLSVIVEGTIFNVNSRKDKVEVFLEEGKISLVTSADKNNVKELKPGDLVRYNTKSMELKFSQKQKETQSISSWKDGAILFQEASLLEVLKKLNEIYGVEFEVNDKEVLSKKITAGIPVSQLNVALKMLEDVLGIEIELTGKSTYTIH